MVAAEKIRSYGGSYAPDGSGVDFYDNPRLNDEDIVALSWALREFRPDALTLDGTVITDAALDTIARIHGLRVVTLGGTSVTPEGVAGFLRQAQSLHLVGVPNDWDKDARSLAALRAMEREHPEVEIRLSYHNGDHWVTRSIGGQEYDAAYQPVNRSN